jgi:hypothetical protein
VEAAREDLKAANARIDEARKADDRAQAEYMRAKDGAASMSTRWWIFVGALAAALIFVAVVFTYLSSEKRREHENRLLVATMDKPATVAGDPFELNTRWLDNQQQLQNYHQLVLNYASSTRQTTLATLVAGFSFLVIIGVVAISARDIPSAIATSVLATATAAVTAFIARAVLRNADTSSREMLSFFSHPLEVQRLLAAERVAQGMPESARHQADLLIVSALTARPVGAERSPKASGVVVEPEGPSPVDET